MRFTTAALALAATLALSASATAQRASGAENGLVGIKLYDPGLRVIQVYGTPDDIQGISFGGGGAAGPTGGGRGVGPGGPGFGPAGPSGPGAPLGAPGGGSPGNPPGAPGGPAVNPFGFSNDGFGFGTEILRQGGRAGVDDIGGPAAAPGSMGGVGQGPTGGPPMGPRGPFGPAGGGPAGGGGGATGAQGDRITYTRWVYRRGGSRYGFVIDNQNRVVQIEAVGLANNKVRTRRGVGFGATFADLIKKYRTPESYDISGDTILVRFLLRDKVAFRLNRLGENKPHVVTGIVVAAGKGA